MQISPIFQNFQPKFNNNQKSISYKNTLEKDIFTRNTNKISFCAGKINPKYSALSSEMTKYIINSPTITEQEIEKIIQKYSPTTTFERMENLQTNRKTTNGSAGYTKIPTKFIFNDSGNIEIEADPKTVFVYIPENLDKRGRIILLDRILHECTHVLQEESKDRTSTQEFFNPHIKNSKNIQATSRTLGALPNIFVNLEEISTHILYQSNIAFDSLPTKLENSNLTFDKLCQISQRRSASEFLSGAISFLINEYNVQDIDLVLDYITLKAGNELEAYNNALSSNKTQMNINGKTNFDIRIEMYTKMIEAVKRLKGLKRF